MTLRRGGQLVAVVLTAMGGMLLFASPAAAHPLGNATVNSADRLVVAPNLITVTHVLDLAEIPTLQAQATIDEGETDVGRFASARCADDARLTILEVDGAQAELSVVSATADFAEGQAELQTLRVECTWEANTAGADAQIDYQAAPIDIAGWREVSAAGDRVTLANSNVPTESPSDLLRSYPEVSPTDIPQTTSASLDVTGRGPGLNDSSPVASTATESDAVPTDASTRWLGGLIDGATSPLGALLTLVLAGIIGALHALTPGHGKTAVAFALAGQERSPKAALTVGATVTATHTASVLLFGTLVATTTMLAPSAWIPVLTALSGLLVLAVGLMLLHRASRGERGHVHLGSAQHENDHHHHEHEHGHPHEHSDERRPADGHVHHHSSAATTTAVLEQPKVAVATKTSPKRRGGRSTLVALGVAGGVVPSPSALLVLLGAAGLGRPWWGVLLVIAFGLGMAVTLALAGLLAWQVGERVSSWAARRRIRSVDAMIRWFPQLAAFGVCGAGLVVIARGVGIV